jgi:two-component system nitrogen regulation response regulator NtrX
VLAQYFLAGYTGAYGRQAKELSDGAVDVMMRYSWPGNVRELRNVIERLVIVCPQQRIEPHHLPPELFRSSAHTPQTPPATLHEARSAYERDFILRKLEENQWNMTRTATAIGLERSHLYRKMKSLGISSEEKDEKGADSDEA